MQQGLFYFFASCALLAASFVVFTKNSVYAVLSLVLTFVMTAALWLMLEAEFLAITLVLVYVGAVMVLFLFVVMMLDIETTTLRAGFIRYWPFAILLLMSLGMFFAYAYSHKELFGAVNVILPQHGAEYNNVKALGMELYTKYLFAFEIAGILLFVGIIAAISLTFRGRRNSRYQEPSQQVHVDPNDRVKLVDGV